MGHFEIQGFFSVNNFILWTGSPYTKFRQILTLLLEFLMNTDKLTDRRINRQMHPQTYPPTGGNETIKIYICIIKVRILYPVSVSINTLPVMLPLR